MNEEEISKLQEENEALKDEIDDLNTEIQSLESEIENVRVELEEAKGGLKILHALQAAGVDNWDGYDQALDMLEE